jgi:AraC-like DNA-binding protein
MNYQEFPPAESLAKAIECYWFIQGNARSVSNTVFPDGCMDIIWDFSNNSFQRDNERMFVVGNMTRPIEVFSVGDTDLFGVRFRPGGLSRWIRVPLNEFTDTSASLKDVLKVPESVRVLLLKTKTRAKRIEVLNNFFLRNEISCNSSPWQFGLDRLIKTKGNLSIQKISGEAGISQKHLERKFKEHVGITPKQLSIVLRFRELREKLDKKPLDLLQLAVDLNYTDQAHLAKSFKSMAGITPGEYLRSLY